MNVVVYDHPKKKKSRRVKVQKWRTLFLLKFPSMGLISLEVLLMKVETS